MNLMIIKIDGQKIFSGSFTELFIETVKTFQTGKNSASSSGKKANNVSTSSENYLTTITNASLELENHHSLHANIRAAHAILKEEEFIGSKVDLKKMDKLFSARNTEKILWLGSQSELKYFINGISKLLVESNRKWINVKAVFIKKTGSPFYNVDNPGSSPHKSKMRLLDKAINCLIN